MANHLECIVLLRKNVKKKLNGTVSFKYKIKKNLNSF